ncbi:MAG: HYR domain-containing protein, partial [Saprospirales bacterium]
GITTVTWTAVDTADNTVTDSHDIEVFDDEAPRINDCPSDFTVFTDGSSCDVIASWSPPVDFEDNCALATFDVWGVGPDGDTLNIFNTNPGSCLNTLGYVGAYSPGLWTVTQSTGEADFSHDDEEYEVDLSPGVAGAVFDTVVGDVNVPADYQGVVSMRVVQTSQGGPSGSGVTIEVNGSTIFSNTSFVSATNFVSFNVFPGDVITYDISVTKENGSQHWANVVVDNFSFLCDNSQANANIGLGTSTITYQLEDLEGNDTTCVFEITLEDNDAPVANGQDVTVEVVAGQSKDVPATAFDAGSTDNCGIVEYLVRENPAGPVYTVDCSNVGDTIALEFIVCDAAGNCDTTDVNLIVEELAIPVIAFCPADQVVDTDAGECGAEVTYPTPRVHDGCSADSAMALLDGLASGEMFDVGVNTVTWFHVGKNTGDTVLCQFNVVVEDNEAPTVNNCPSDITVDRDAGSCSAEVFWTEPTADDNCTDSADILVVQNKFPGDEFPVGKSTVQYTFTDAAGNSSQCEFDITVEDDEVPFVLCQDFTTELDECGEVVVYANDIRVSAEADCGIASVEIEINGEGFNLDSVVLDCNYLGVNNAVFRATTKAGVTNTCEAEVTINDEIAPEVECYADFFVYISYYDTTECTVTNILEDTDFAYANCSQLPLDPGQYYTNDTCGVETSYTITHDGNVIASGGPFAGPVGFDPGTETFELGENTVTVTVEDANGLSDQCDFTITVIDDVDPIVNCPADITVDNDEGECGAIVDFEAEATDNCAVDTTFYSQDPDTFFPVGTTTVTFTAEDESENSSSCTFDVTVVDNEDPIITCPEDQIVTTSEDGTTGDCLFLQDTDDWDATATDNCDILSITHDYAIDTNTTVAGAFSDTTLLLARFAGPCDETTVTWTAEDIHGNTASCSFTVTVRDDEAPKFDSLLVLTNTDETCGDTVRLVNLTNTCHAELLWHRPTLDDTYDNCWASDSLTLEEHIDEPSVASAVNQNFPFGDGSTASSPEVDFPVGVTTITYTLSDRECLDYPANETTCVLTVVVEDTQEPTITCPSPQNIYSICSDTEIPDYIGSSSVQDNCSDYDVEQSPAPGTTLGQANLNLVDGETFDITLTVTQQSYNENFDEYSVDCNFTVTLVDEDQWTPTVGIPQGFLPTTELISCGGGSVVITAPTATKPDPTDCSDIMTIYGELSSSNSNYVDLGNGEYELEIGTYNISWVYNGGPLNQFQEINVVADYIDPDAVCQDIVVQLDANGEASIDAEDVDGGSTDNCGIASYEVDIDEFTCADLVGSPIAVTLTVTDLDGNQDDCVAFVTVEDNIDPVAQCEEEITVYLDENGQASITVDDVNDGSSDNCDIVSYDLSQTDFDCGDLGSNTVTLTVTDQSANSDECQTTVNVVDEIAPIAECADVTIELSSDGFAEFDVDAVTPMGCIRTTAWATTTLTITGITQTLSTCHFVTEYTTVIVPEPGIWEFATDNSNDYITISTTTNDVLDAGTTPVAYDFTSAGTYRIHFAGDSDCATVPTGCRTTTATYLGTEGGGSNVYAADLLDGGTTDNCGEFEISLSESEFNCSDVGDNDVTVTYTDPSGNSSSCISVVTVEDNTAPDFTCPESFETCVAEQLIVADEAWDACDIASVAYNAEGATEFSGFDYEIDEKFNPGVTTITYTIEDENGNQTVCSFTVNVTDSIPPVAACTDKVNVALGPDGFVTLPATIVDQASFDTGCDPVEPLTFLFDINEADNPVSEFTFGCEHIGDNDVELYVMDAAWNTASCLTTITIQDNTAPVAVCTEDVIEIYVNNGAVTVTADQINDGSTDNSEPCFDITLEAQNNVFTLDDVGTQTVVLLVTDEFNNYSTCEATVEVLSGVPTAECVDMISVELDSDGLATIDASDIDDGSSDPEDEILTLSVDPSTFTCADAGSDVVVTLTVTDPHGNEDECTSVVSVSDMLDPLAICQDITVELDADGNASTTPEAVDNGSFDNCGPVILSLDEYEFDCGDVGDNDVVLTVEDQNGNVSSCDAVVTVEDNISPTFVCDDELTLVLNNQGEGSIVPADVLETSVSDNCGIDDMVLSQSEFDCEDLGYNSVTLTVTDVNGNSESCEFTLVVSASTGVCPEIALISEDVEGSVGDVVCVPITVENFTDITGVQFSVEFDSAVATVLGIQESGLTNVEDNIIGNTITVSWFESLNNAVTLADGSEIFCIEVELVGDVDDVTGAIITDTPVSIEVTQGLQVVPVSIFSGTVSITAPAATADIAGLIETEYGVGIEDVTVNVTGDVTTSVATDVDGFFDISVLLGSDVTLTPYENDNHSQGVTTMDLILIQRHLLLIESLDSPYKLIAADVSNDGILSTFDLVILQALIIGNINEYPNNTSWRFIDADFTFTDPANPFADTWPESISINDLTADDLGNDFVAVKIGDVNESIGFSGAQTRGVFNFLVDDKSYRTGDLVEVSFNANNFVDMTGYQFTLDYDALNLEFVGFENPGNVDNLSDANVNAIENGSLNLNWYNAKTNSLAEGTEVFNLTFRATSDIDAISEHINVSNTGLSAEAYNAQDDVFGVDIEFITTGMEGEEFVLYQNVPNPFSGTTVIGFELPKASNATIEIIDETGKLIRSMNRDFDGGYNEVRVDVSDLNGSGVYFYRLTTADHSAVKSMILVD